MPWHNWHTNNPGLVGPVLKEFPPALKSADFKGQSSPECRNSSLFFQKISGGYIPRLPQQKGKTCTTPHGLRSCMRALRAPTLAPPATSTLRSLFDNSSTALNMHFLLNYSGLSIFAVLGCYLCIIDLISGS